MRVFLQFIELVNGVLRVIHQPEMLDPDQAPLPLVQNRKVGVYRPAACKAKVGIVAVKERFRGKDIAPEFLALGSRQMPVCRWNLTLLRLVRIELEVARQRIVDPLLHIQLAGEKVRIRSFCWK